MNEKYREICENLNWTVHEYEDGSVDLEKYSPAGEDFIFEVDSDCFVDKVKDYADCFDVDEHVEIWVDGRGKRGVPSSVRELVEDAVAIDKMLQELANALAEVEDDEEIPEREWKLGDDLATCDNLLDGITFDDIIMQVHCNCRSITPDAVRKEVDDLLELRLADMRELLDRNIDTIVTEAGKGRL